MSLNRYVRSDRCVPFFKVSGIIISLNDVYVDSKGWQKFVGTQNKGVVTKDTDRLWEEAYKEILKESKFHIPGLFLI